MLSACNILSYFLSGFRVFLPTLLTVTALTLTFYFLPTVFLVICVIGIFLTICFMGWWIDDTPKVIK